MIEPPATGMPRWLIIAIAVKLVLITAIVVAVLHYAQG